MGGHVGADAITAESVIALVDLVHEIAAVLYVDAAPMEALAGMPSRRTRMNPNLVVPAGIYAFEQSGRWRVVVSRSEAGQPNRKMFQHAVAPGSDVWAALMTLNVNWDGAEVVGRTSPAFRRGDGVQLVGGAGEVGTVAADAVVADDGWQYRVRFGSTLRNVPESGLVAVVDLDESPSAWSRMAPASLDEFRLLVALTKLSRPLSDVVYAFGATRTVFRPYQFKPLLKLLQTNSQRLLIADEVGLGKTIEAGLIWTELHQRAGIRRGLVVCPAALTRKWRDEMKRRFDVELEIINRTRLEEFAASMQAGDDPSLTAAISLESLRSANVLDDLAVLRPRFDLVIVDEAHYLRNRETRSFQLGELLTDWADVLLFLSATPLNLGTDDLFNLLNLLAEDEFPDPVTFRDQLEPNSLLNDAARRLTSEPDSFDLVIGRLRQLEHVALGSSVRRRPQVGTIERLLERRQPLDALELTTCKRSLLELNTLSSIVTRTRKVDVPDAKATRVADTIDVEWSDRERRFYFAVLAWARARALANNGVVGFATVMPLRQAASCLPAMRDLIDEKYVRLAFEDEDFDEQSFVMVDEPGRRLSGEELVTSEALSVVELRTAAQELGDTDTKFDMFLAKLRAIKVAEIEQVMVFSFFRRTLAYISRRLRSEFTLRVMDGSVPQDQRARIMQDFREGKFELLLVSEVGSEGLDFEFVGALVNYDLPWNPMRVEQRIGRLDRFGQKHERIHIFNFHVPGTIETDIFERLYRRIRVFEESIGELEPILRNQVSEITRIVLDPRRSDDERQLEVDRIALAVENKRADLNELQEQSSGLMTGLDQILIDGFTESVLSAGRYVGSDETRLVVSQLIADTGAALRPPGGTSKIWEIRGSVDLERRLVQLGRQLRNRRVEDLSVRLRAGETVYAIFDSEASIGVTAELVVSGHPLVVAAVAHLGDAAIEHWRHGSVSVGGEDPGRYVALLAVLEVTGAQPARELVSVAVDVTAHGSVAEVGELVLAAAARGELEDGVAFEPSPAVIEALEQRMVRRRNEVEHERTQTNEAQIEARTATLRKTYGYKISKARETLAVVRGASRAASIERLYEGRIANLEARLAADLADLDRRRELTVTWQPIAVVDVTVNERG